MRLRANAIYYDSNRKQTTITPHTTHATCVRQSRVAYLAHKFTRIQTHQVYVLERRCVCAGIRIQDLAILLSYYFDRVVHFNTHRKFEMDWIELRRIDDIYSGYIVFVYVIESCATRCYCAGIPYIPRPCHETIIRLLWRCLRRRVIRIAM